MYDVFTVAENIVWYAKTSKRPINNLKLQKVLYYLQAESVVSKRIPFFDGEFEAWDIGPVMPKIYKHYSVYCGGSIWSGKKPTMADDDWKMLVSIFEECNKYSLAELSEFARNQMPYIAAKRYHIPISNVMLYDFFKEDT